MALTVRAFQQEMEKLIAGSDGDIVEKQITIASPETLFPPMPELVSAIDEPAVDIAQTLDQVGRRHLSISNLRWQKDVPCEIRGFHLGRGEGIRLFPSSADLRNGKQPLYDPKLLP